ncbi:MAG: bifunctional DNA-formamidopyrimidine glycosylase/DNA-(apurinic or apyrimidinic site) lyase [Solirubrobacterales bacterium]
MPELPEVETIRRQLAPELTGAVISHAEILDPRFSRPGEPAPMADGLRGRRIEKVDRRGKYLLLVLDADRTLAIHLRMTGNLLLEPAAGPTLDPSPVRLYTHAATEDHLRARLHLADGRILRYTDVRRFGHGALLLGSEQRTYIDGRLGPEPLGQRFGAEHIARHARGRRAPLKSFLLDQKVVAGMGNIYADETLFRARLHPLSPAGSTRAEHHERLAVAATEALVTGIEHGGASISDYRDATGAQGSAQEEFLVHTRAGRPCMSCAESVRRIVVGGRATHFCPRCQMRLRARRRATAR